MKTILTIIFTLILAFLIGYFVLGFLGYQVSLEKRGQTNSEVCAVKGVEDINTNTNTNINNMNTTNQTETPTEIKELMAQILKPGSGEQKVQPGDTITVHYVGTLINGTKFDSSRDRGQPLQLIIGVGQVIPGWDQGIIGMQVGEIRKLLIPANLAYGEQGAGNVIPPNSPLIFEVELVSIDKVAEPAVK
ncbi:MAG: FKBP-type peptidyl-prolyl cis-trans isomerase [Patescibacteria group bacterium]|nr:FKBP-type peptidyl-prolyl cis-trans isomerase [Patescibacteria group bacterium]